MLSYGQAACLVLDKYPSIKNRKMAKLFFENSPLAVVYLCNGDPMEPMIVAESIARKNPYKYRRYPPIATTQMLLPTFGTFENGEVDVQGSPSSPVKTVARTSTSCITPAVASSSRITPTAAINKNERLLITDTNTNVNTAIDTTNHGTSKADIIDYLKTTYRATEPANDDDYEALFITNLDFYEELKGRHPQLEHTLTLQQLCLWLNKESATFGPLKARRVDGICKKGRALWRSKRAL
ncbi:hypothetical protein BCR42DRAFT_42768 [Absidia repens]|uniref:Uncharacterized protein n=1 Tax=Absidia repens TaxID=90262 RepID=A0A1X2IFU0_9FUNG|nr:hypothetical protein BCR42DRAFT_42768 [Absidia repens]